MIQQPPAKSNIRPAIKTVGKGAAGFQLTPAGKLMTFDPNAVQAAVGSLYETLKKCEDERVKLVSLMDDARAVSSQRQNLTPKTQTSDAAVPAKSDNAPNADPSNNLSAADPQQMPYQSLTAHQLSQVPALDAWISRRLSELHAADRSLSQRQQKLQTLEQNLTRISQGLSSQLNEITRAKDELAGEQGSIEARMAAVRHRLDEQTQQAQAQVDQHLATINQAQSQVDEGLAHVQTTGTEAMATLNKQFETLAQSIVGRLEGVRKPVENWLHQHLAQYEVMLNEKIEEAHLPLVKRIVQIQDQVSQAVTPIEQNLQEQLQALQTHVAATSQQIQINMQQQADEVHQSMVTRVQRLDEEVAKLIEPVLVAAGKKEQAILDQAASLEEAFEDKLSVQRLSFERTLQEQAYTTQTQIRVAVQSANTQMAQHVKDLQANMTQHTAGWTASAQTQVQDALKQIEVNMSRGFEDLGHKSKEVEQWYANRRKEMNAQMNELEDQARAAADSAEQIMTRRVNESRKQLPNHIDQLMAEAQKDVQVRVEQFQQQIQSAYQTALADSVDQTKYLESQTVAQFKASDQRMRQRMSALHGDAKSMLDMIENQLTRRVEACQKKVANVKMTPDQAATSNASDSDNS